MEKRGVLVVFVLSFLVLSAFSVIAATNSTNDKAVSCVQNQISSKGCSTLSTEEKIFSLLAVGKCKTELLSASSSNQCWSATSSSSCSVKTTAQAILALNSGTATAEKWLSSQNQTTSDIDWFLQVESANATTCTVTYGSGSYTFNLNEDKTLSGNAGSCLTMHNNYWFQISPSCFDNEFKISCSDSFLTSLLYKKTSSDTLYISDQTNSASGEGTTTEKVNSLCFAEGGSCTYEGTLWAALVLNYKKYDITAYVPYLIAFADDNTRYIPYSFIYALTNNYQTDLLAQQQEKQWWLESGDKFYDTAVALLPFQNTQIPEKTNSINWLSSVQGTDGCWQGNLRNTAFLIYSLWPQKIESTITTPDCTTSSYYCMSQASCSAASGNVLDTYGGCFGTNICCDQQSLLPTCVSQGGELCDSQKSEQCLGGTTVSSSDSTAQSSCCINGVCGQQQTTECETNGGTCAASCLSNQQSVSYACGSFQSCCVQKKTSYVWLIILLIVLIALAVLGIIYRKQLRTFLMNLVAKIKSKFGKGKGKPSPSQGPGPRFPPTSSQRVYPGAVQRRIIPQQAQRPVARPVQNKSDFDDVLKKLKEIGK